MKAKFMTVFSFLMLIFSAAHADSGGEWFFRNNVSNDSRLVELHMLGAHDAFTAGLNENSHQDDAGIKLGDQGAVASQSGENGEGDPLWAFLSLNMSRAQSADVYTMLNSGVRYFDIRLSRYQWGGEFYTVHGRVSDQFTGADGIARKISAWANSHPGELIILDFQSLFDIQTDTGGATQDSWRDLMSRLTADGITQFVHTSNGSINSLTYGELTDNGSRAAIVLIGQVTGSWADSRFINRRDEDGYVRSNWTSQSSYDNMRSKLAEEIAELMNNSDKYYYRFRIMQAQTTGLNLIDDANGNNIKILTDPDFDAWSELLPVLMVDNATSDSADFNAKAIDLLAKKNREYSSGIYRAADGNYTLTGSNDNVPLGTKFTAVRNGDTLTLGGEITGEMTLIIKSSGKKQRLYKGDVLLGETGSDGLLRARISSLGEYRLTDTEEETGLAASIPLLRYSFTDGLADVTGDGLDALPEGSPSVGGGIASLSPGNVIKLPAGLTKHMKEYTVTAWINLGGSQSNTRFFDIGRHQRSNVFGDAGTDKASSGTKFSETVRAQSGGLTTGRWTHLAAQYDDGKFTLYVDGKKSAEAVNNGKNSAPQLIEDYFNSKGSYIGRTMWYAFGENAGDNPDMNGKIADFRIYDTALTAGEIGILGSKLNFAKFIDIDTDEEICPAQVFDGFENVDGYSFPQSIDNYELVRVAPDIAEYGVGETVGYYRSSARTVDSLSISRDGGTVKADLTLAAEKPGAMLVLALYRDGGLAAVKLEDVNGFSAVISLEAPENTEVKAFLWDKETLRPYLYSTLE